MVFLSSQVDVWGVGFPGEQRLPAGGCGPSSQSGRGGEPLVQDSGLRRVQVAATSAAATPVLHLYRLPAEVSVAQRKIVWPGSLWGSYCCAAYYTNDCDNNTKTRTTRLPSVSRQSVRGLRIPTWLNVNCSQLIRMSQFYLTV